MTTSDPKRFEGYESLSNLFNPVSHRQFKAFVTEFKAQLERGTGDDQRFDIEISVPDARTGKGRHDFVQTDNLKNVKKDDFLRAQNIEVIFKTVGAADPKEITGRIKLDKDTPKTLYFKASTTGEACNFMVHFNTLSKYPYKITRHGKPSLTKAVKQDLKNKGAAFRRR